MQGNAEIQSQRNQGRREVYMKGAKIYQALKRKGGGGLIFDSESQ